MVVRNCRKGVDGRIGGQCKETLDRASVFLKVSLKNSGLARSHAQSCKHTDGSVHETLQRRWLQKILAGVHFHAAWLSALGVGGNYYSIMPRLELNNLFSRLKTRTKVENFAPTSQHFLTKIQAVP